MYETRFWLVRSKGGLIFASPPPPNIMLNNGNYFHEIQAREFLSKLGDLHQTQIFAKIENIEVCLI